MPEEPLELLHAVVEQLILGCRLVGYELLEKLLVANEHIHEILAQVLLLQLLSVEVQEDGPPTRQLGGVDLNQRL